MHATQETYVGFPTLRFRNRGYLWFDHSTLQMSEVALVCISAAQTTLRCWLTQRSWAGGGRFKEKGHPDRSFADALSFFTDASQMLDHRVWQEIHGKRTRTNLFLVHADLLHR